MDPSVVRTFVFPVNFHRILPVSGSIAATWLYGHPRYRTPFTISGIDWLSRNGTPSFRIWRLQAGTSLLTLVVLICFRGE